MGRVRSPKLRVRDDDFILVCILAEAIQGFFAQILNAELRARRSILVKLADDTFCSAHCTGRFTCDADQSCRDSCFAAGTFFGEVADVFGAPRRGR